MSKVTLKKQSMFNATARTHKYTTEGNFRLPVLFGIYVQQ